MLYKNKIKGQNILKSAVALMLMLTLSLSTALSPLAKAEEAGYTWKTLTSAPPYNPNFGGIYINSDGSKLFILEKDNSYNTNLWMSADDGATWKKILSKQIQLRYAQPSFSADGSKIALTGMGEQYLYISTDGGQNWTERGPDPRYKSVKVSPDGSFLVGCSGSNATGYITHISTDDGQTWTQKGTNNIGCPRNVFNNGTIISKQVNDGEMAKSTDYGQTWIETPGVLSGDHFTAFSNNGNNVFEGDRISLDGGNHWTPLNAPIPAGDSIFHSQISDDGKKLSITTYHLNPAGGGGRYTFLTSVDGGRTWNNSIENDYESILRMSSDGSKLFYMAAYMDAGNPAIRYRVGTLSTSQPVTPGSGAGGTVTPSTGSASATPGQKPGKASGRLAETGTSTWMVGGLAVVAVAAGALVLRKRL